MTTIQVIELTKRNIQKEITHNSKYVSYDRKDIMKYAHRLFKQGVYTFSECLKQAWQSAKRLVNKARKELKAANNRMMDLYTPERKPISQESIVTFLKTI